MSAAQASDEDASRAQMYEQIEDIRQTMEAEGMQETEEFRSLFVKPDSGRSIAELIAEEPCPIKTSVVQDTVDRAQNAIDARMASSLAAAVSPAPVESMGVVEEDKVPYRYSADGERLGSPPE